MNNLSLLLCLCFLIQFACTPQKEVEKEVMVEPISLEGTWELISFRSQGDTTWKKQPETVIYQKHITPTHFTWVGYASDKDSLLGTGGGTYTYDSVTQTYTEDIQFFYPAGSNELGQAIPFSVGMEEGQWFHKGYAKVLEFDPDLGENVAVDSSVIDEIWERTDLHPSDDSNGSLVSTWNLQSSRGSTDSLWSEYPDFVGYMKLVTPTHFIWVKYNSEGDEVMGTGGGSYSVKGDQYIEHLQFFHPTRPGFNGATATFKFSRDGDQWQISGTVDDGSGEESSEFEEIWHQYN